MSHFADLLLSSQNRWQLVPHPSAFIPVSPILSSLLCLSRSLDSQLSWRNCSWCFIAWHILWSGEKGEEALPEGIISHLLLGPALTWHVPAIGEVVQSLCSYQRCYLIRSHHHQAGMPSRWPHTRTDAAGKNGGRKDPWAQPTSTSARISLQN